MPDTASLPPSQSNPSDQVVTAQVDRTIGDERSADMSMSATPVDGAAWFTVVAICCGVLVLGMIGGAGLWMTAAVSVAAVVGLGNLIATSWSQSIVAVREDLPGEGSDLELVIGSRVNVRIAVTNQGRLPIAWVLAEDLLPVGQSIEKASEYGEAVTAMFRVSPISVEGARLGVMVLMPGATKHLEYTVHFKRRGYYQIGPTVLETGDPVGMFRRYRLGTRPMYVTVLPKIELLSTYEVGSNRPIGEIRIRENVMADPTRLRGIRQWQIGDPMRSVHWAATARTGTLHSKIYEPSSVIGATLVVDMHVSTNPDRHEPVRTDLSIMAAASIAAALHDAGEPFGLATNGRDAADRIRTEGFQGDHRVRDVAGKAATMRQQSDRLRPVLCDVDRGPLQLKEVVRTLARLERTDGLTLSEFLIETQSRLSNETTLIVLMQSAPEESIAALIGMARRGWSVAVVLNTLDIDAYTSVAGPLLDANIHVAHLADRNSIMDVCRQTMIR